MMTSRRYEQDGGGVAGGHQAGGAAVTENAARQYGRERLIQS
ncbi:MAG: hypothetical protein ACYSTF_10440 [Planctomycetota bacterium]